jgi:hypothetical protein
MAVCQNSSVPNRQCAKGEQTVKVQGFCVAGGHKPGLGRRCDGRRRRCAERRGLDAGSDADAAASPSSAPRSPAGDTPDEDAFRLAHRELLRLCRYPPDPQDLFKVRRSPGSFLL